MEFCPVCGKRLAPTRKKGEEQNSLLLSCPKCDYEKQTNEPLATLQKVVERTPQEDIVVIGKKEQKLRTLPTVKLECPKCENNLAYAWQVQTRSGDEASTQFFRCTKCNYTVRKYS
jgi:DNA-directed RNA polymerase subunit M